MLKFSSANSKIKALSQVDSLQNYLDGRKVYSLDLLSGWSCPYAKDCLSKVHIIDGKKKLIDGNDTKFRCFSASQEIAFPGVYNLRKHNFDLLKKLSFSDMVDLIQKSMPKNLGINRIDVGGDIFKQDYFDAWIKVAENNPDKLFYGYTKSLPFWVARLEEVPYNLVLTASYGGRCDSMITEYGLRYSKVVFHPNEAKKLKLEIDHDDSHAADPTKKNKSFALLIHGIQSAGSLASDAIKRLKKEKIKFSYS